MMMVSSLTYVWINHAKIGRGGQNKSDLIVGVWFLESDS